MKVKLLFQLFALLFSITTFSQTINQPNDLSVCDDDNDGIAVFNLDSQDAQILGSLNPADYTITYHETQADAGQQLNPLVSPYTNTSNPQTIFVSVLENATGNLDIRSFNLIVNTLDVPGFSQDVVVCDESNGFGTFDLTLFDDEFIGNNPDFIVTYHQSLQDALSNTNPISNPSVYINTTPFTQTLYPRIEDTNTGCFYVSQNTALFLNVSDDLNFATPPPYVLCDDDDDGITVFDLDAYLPEILNGNQNPTLVTTFHLSPSDADTNVNAIGSPYTNVTAFNQTIYVRIESISGNCFQIVPLELVVDINCLAENTFNVVCGDDAVNTSYCYDINEATPYIYQSSDGSPLQVFFNAGQVEVDWDELVVLDSDGVTNLNAGSTIYGNNGDLTGLSFTSSGSTITVFVDSDNVFSCVSENYIPIDYDVSCVDPSALPNCNSFLVSPENSDVDVNENIDLTWTASSGVVNGYKLSVGITSGGTEVLDYLDVGNVLTYDIGTLDYEVTYYVTIVPYNDNGDAIACTEESFTTRANPNQTVICDDGAVNTTYCYGNNDDTEFNFQSSDGQTLTLFFNAGSTEVNFDTIQIIDSDGSVMNPNLPYGNGGDFSGLTYTSTGDSISVRFDSDGTISCQAGSACCASEFDFDVFCSSSVGIIDVNAFFDANTNAVYDANESGFTNGYFTYEVNGDGNINTVNSSNGNFQIISANDTDTYTITFNLYEASAGCYDVTTTTFSNVSVAEGNTITVDFPVVEEQSCEDLAVYLINNGIPPRPGFTHNNLLVLENLGFTTIASGTVEFTHDPLLVYNNVSNVNPNDTVTNSPTGFTVDFVNLTPGEAVFLNVSLNCPVSVPLGEIVTNTASYVTDSNDLVAVNNLSTLSEIVVGSWDPNDKREARGPRIIYDDFLASDEYLYYTIRFQNLGTFPATFVRIEDDLNSQLDESTFQMLRASHDFIVTRTDSHLEWQFDNINLPAEQDDVDGSQGYVYFKIKPKAGYAIGDIIPNTAAIYFDFNAPVITNRFESEFLSDPLSLPEVGSFTFDIFPNPAKEHVIIRLNTNNFGNVTVQVYDLQGKQIMKQPFSEAPTMALDVSDLNSGMYFIQLHTNDKIQVKKLIIE